MLLHSDRSPCDALGSTWVPSWVKLFYPIVEGSNACLFCRPNMFERSGVGKVGKWVRSAVSDPMVTFHFWEEYDRIAASIYSRISDVI